MRSMAAGLISALLMAGALAGGVDDKQLDLLAAAERPVLVKFRDTTLTKVFQSLAEATDTKISVVLERDQVVSVDIEKMSLKEALIRLAESHDLVYEVKSPRELVVKGVGEKKGAG
jgi:type II secretory pathway component GspD/PulD (secretin)